MKSNLRNYVILVTLLWVVTLGGSLFWNIFHLQKTTGQLHLHTARAFFQQLVIERAWNAIHGGIYLDISEKLQPNPYLQVADRDIVTTSGRKLTKVNPAFMTRMISEMAFEKGQFKFHITSLKPINPGNKASAWETEALEQLENKQVSEYFSEYSFDDQSFFRYIAPLIIRESCLSCHRQQGYQLDDVRGGISVTFPIEPLKRFLPIASHLIFLFFGCFLILGSGRRIIRLTEILKKQSHIDGLTQIANRRYFDEILQREWLRSRRLKSPLTVIMSDIDYFKKYNESYGHQSGDSCLQKVALALNKSCQRPTDLVARYGGEEFAAVLPDTSLDGGRVIGEQMLASVERMKIRHKTSSTSDFVTISLGIATMNDYAMPKKELMAAADRALYQAKESGRNIVICAEELTGQ